VLDVPSVQLVAQDPASQGGEGHPQRENLLPVPRHSFLTVAKSRPPLEHVLSLFLFFSLFRGTIRRRSGAFAQARVTSRVGCMLE